MPMEGRNKNHTYSDYNYISISEGILPTRLGTNLE